MPWLRVGQELASEAGFGHTGWLILTAYDVSPVRSMRLLALSINYKFAPAGLRERVAFAPGRLPAALADLLRVEDVAEAAILSTCNRTELYCGLHAAGADAVVGWLGGYHDLNGMELRRHARMLYGRQAVRHLMRVAGGLDSMVLGETEVLGQVKDAYATAVAAGSIGSLLHPLFQQSFAAAKRVRGTTGIGRSTLSMAALPVRLARQRLGTLRHAEVVLVGAGAIIGKVVRYLHREQPRRLCIVNRTLARAQALAARCGAEAAPLTALVDCVAQADVVISATASPTPLLHHRQVAACMAVRRQRPLLLVDLAMPRDLERSDDSNLGKRRHAVAQAEPLITAHVAAFMQHLQKRQHHARLRRLDRAA